jgi:hypothetical protein
MEKPEITSLYLLDFDKYAILIFGNFRENPKTRSSLFTNYEV